MMKTKKKKKKKVVVDEDESIPTADPDKDKAKTGWDASDKDYSYVEMLDRAFVLMQERNPNLAAKYKN